MFTELEKEKRKKFGKPFIELISRYVEDNDIIRPDDLVVKSTGANSANKLYYSKY